MSLHQHKIGLFFGSYNPIHIGHTAIANYIIEFTDLDEIWFVISPHNPLKEKKSLLDDYQRFEMVQLAIEDDFRFRASDIEFRLPQPSYTIDTLTYLHEKHPQHQFCLILGGDNLSNFDKWKNYQTILDYYPLYVYARPGFKKEDFSTNGDIRFYDAPQMDISSSFIRQSIKEGKDVRHFVNSVVWKHMREWHFYEK
ncbi:MAG: nicotinate (nicotinamide) nucleotide adenylyltransferase [Bacteroidales bacterium]|jgi:nicotinate-nucleotide adenylyltransferase|nr:nicotinate (nicotinamide) nucleotide adenylyltransferase [Bacteroidales bacterium]